MRLNPDERKAEDKPPIVAVKFFDEEGDMVVKVDDIELLKTLEKIVEREYSRRVLDMENKLDAL